MLFLCCRPLPTGSKYDIIVGASQESWSDVPAIKDIRRADRNDRLEHYIQRAENAHAELERIEKTQELPIDLSEEDEEDEAVKYERRRLAIKVMISEPNQHFLDMTEEIGQAFDGEKERQSGYACQGMFGFQCAKTWTDEEKKVVLVNFQPRKGYAHSCAEVDASFQCSERLDVTWQNPKSLDVSSDMRET